MRGRPLSAVRRSEAPLIGLNFPSSPEDFANGHPAKAGGLFSCHNHKLLTMTEAVFRASAIAVSEGLADPILGNSAGPAT